MEGKVPALDQAALERALDVSLARAQSDPSNSKLDLSADEAASIRKAFQKPEFRSLFNEYLQEISDPDNKKEYDDYLNAMEKQGKVPENIQLVRPEAGFCVKVKTASTKSANNAAASGTNSVLDEVRKVFVNVCKSDTVDEPVANPVSEGGRTGHSWRLPHLVGPQRMERDKKGIAAETYDVCFHPGALAMADASAAFKDMLARTALDAVVNAVHKVRGSKDFALQVDKYHILVGRACIGDKPGTLNVPKSAKLAGLETLASSVGKNKGQSGGGGDKKSAAAGQATSSKSKGSSTKSETSWSKKGFLNKKKNTKGSGAAKGEAKVKPAKPLVKELTKEELEAKQQPTRNADGTLRPTFTVVHRGKLELANYMTDLTHVPQSTRPKELVVSIKMPAISSAKKVILDVSETHLKVRVPKVYALCVELPFPIDDERGGAKFDKSKRILAVTLPVMPPKFTQEELARAGAGAAEGIDFETTATTSEDAGEAPAADGDGDGGDDSSSIDADYVMVESPSSASKTADGTPYLDSAAQQQLQEQHQSLSEQIAKRAAEAVEAEKARLAALPRPVQDYICRQSGTAITVLVSMAGVAESSLEVDCKPRSVLLRFSVPGSGNNSAVNHELRLKLAGAILPDQTRASVSTKNVVLVLKKEESGMWPDVEQPEGEEDNSQGIDTANSSSGEGEEVVIAEDAPKFVEAAQYSGRKPGYVFCQGRHGLGYYRDTGPFTPLESQFSDDSEAATELEEPADSSITSGSKPTADESADEQEETSASAPDDEGSINVFENNFVFELD